MNLYEFFRYRPSMFLQGILSDANEQNENVCSQPAKRSKNTIFDRILAEFEPQIEETLLGLSPSEQPPVFYTFFSSPSQRWNMIVGLGCHCNNRWNTRIEFGFLGVRQSFFINFN